MAFKSPAFPANTHVNNHELSTKNRWKSSNNQKQTKATKPTSLL